jgi:hypothetical protein
MIGCALLIIVLLLNTIWGDVQLGQHAAQKHQADAFMARQVIGHYGGPGNRWDCPDGRVRIVVRTAARWAVMVLEGDVEVTSFMTDSHDYVSNMIEDCDNPFRYSHP